jgi:hypothetical protein
MRGVVAATLLIMPAAMMRVIETRINRRHTAQLPRFGKPLNQDVEHRAATTTEIQSMKGAAERVVIRHVPHSDVSAPVLSIAQQRFGGAKTHFQLLAKDQAGEQLRSRKIVAAELRMVIGHHLARKKMSQSHHLPWRFAGQHPLSSTRKAFVAPAQDSVGRDRAAASPYHLRDDKQLFPASYPSEINESNNI